MKNHYRGAFGIAIIIAIIIASPSIAASDWSDPNEVNRLISGVESSVISPGEEGELTFVFTNPFDTIITDIKVHPEAYLHVFEDGTTDWDNVRDPPLVINTSSSSGFILIPSLNPNENLSLEWMVQTTKDTSHGGLFSQSIYLVRLSITFMIGNESVSYASRGYFSDDQWERLRNVGENIQIGGIDIAYLESLGYDGIIPELSFIVREKIPKWPIVIIILAGAFSFSIGLYYFLEKTPSSAPKAYRILRNIRKRLLQVWSTVRNGLSKR